MRKFLGLMVLAAIILSPIGPAKASYDQTSAQTYLLAHSNNSWATMALSVLGTANIPSSYLTNISGTSAIDYEAPILAIAALGQNPRTFGATDYVSALENFHTQSQIGDPATLNDDYFGILALVAAGQPLTEPAIVDAKNFILAHQAANGGFGFTTASNPDSNMTAAAILALLASGVASSDSHIQAAVTYLQGLQGSDGGLAYDNTSSSDSSSTAWLLWALNALHIDPTTWNKSGHTPISYLQGNQQASGFFQFQNSSGEDSFSAVTTAYAAIALAGKALPVGIYSVPSNFTAGNSATANSTSTEFSFRIEGSANTTCAGQTAGITALDIVKNATTGCNYTYDIKNTSFGPYLDQINSDAASGNLGWIYLVNNVEPPVGAANYQLNSGDTVVWYYGDYSWLPTKLSLSASQINSNQTVTVSVESFNNNAWSPLAKATVYYGAATSTTDSNGQAIISPPAGFYKVVAGEQGYVRSNAESLTVGQPASSNVSLSVDIGGGQVLGTSTVVSFLVNPGSLDFGTVKPGNSADKNLSVTDNGTSNISIQTQLTGDSIFTDNLRLNNTMWQNLQLNLTAGQSQNVDAKLSIPSGYQSNSGQKSGQLTFWAISQ